MFIIISVLIEGRKRFSVVLLPCVKYYISERKSKTYFLKIAHMKITPEHTHLYIYIYIYISKVFANCSFYFNVHLKCLISWYASKYKTKLAKIFESDYEKKEMEKLLECVIFFPDL